MRKEIFYPILILLIFVTITPIMATITASYTPETSLNFTTGTILNSTIPGNPINSSYFGAHLGTLTIISSETMTDLSLVNMSMTTEHFGYTGTMFYNEYDWADWKNPVKIYRTEETEFTLYALSYPNENLSFKQIYGTDGLDLLTNASTISNTSVFIVELYLINEYALSHYVEGASYQLTRGNPGTFKVAVANAGSNIYNSVNLIPVNGFDTKIDFINNSGALVPYGPPATDPEPPNYQFSISGETKIILSQFNDSIPFQIAKAKMTIFNGIAGKTYAAKISFASNSVDSERFNLRLDGDQNLYKIPYDLIFNGEPVEPVVLGATPTFDQIIPWDGIHYQNATELPIYVTGIDKTTAEQLPAGAYSDTISVIITSVDQM